MTRFFCKTVYAIALAAAFFVLPATHVGAQQSEKVYFEFGVSSLTPEAAAVVEEALKNAKEVGATRIDVVGHADNAEKASNQISLLRATAVRNELVRLGLPENVTVYVSGVGTASPMVPTKDREPLNRYVSISAE